MKIEKYRYIDCHSHPHDKKFLENGIDVDKFLIDLKNDGGGTIAIGTDYELSKQAIELALKHENVWATIGIHPADNHAEVWNEEMMKGFINKDLENYKLTRVKKIVGIGECGLDYFYFTKIYGGNWQENESCKQEINRQKEIFIKQVEFAIKKDLPIVIHGRPSKGSMDAYEDILNILEGYSRLEQKKQAADATSHPPQSETTFKTRQGSLRGHAHFFVGDLKIAKRFLDLGFLLSFDGPITFTTEYDEVIKFIPIGKIMIETDSPYASPMPYRGQINYPAYVKEVAKKIAFLKNLSLEEVLEITKNNAIQFFKLT